MKAIRTERPALCCPPIAGAHLSEQEASTTAALCKALADPSRVLIVNHLASAGAPVCVCDFTALLGVSQPTVSFHLKKLVDSGLLVREQRGVWAYYSLNRPAVERLSGVFRF
ncbi:MAG: helix-turn-helix transcriptional regulator [Actinobacteria bacterium]|nr:helix-turn-helix transcriptional regulator [Actinomycetota bacterium]